MTCAFKRVLPYCIVPGLLVAFFSLFPHAVLAQASTTAGKTAEISAFGGVEIASPEYGPAENAGGALGADFTRFLRHFPIAPSFEFRANFNDGTYADESSYLFGLRALYGYGRFAPYLDYLVGAGDIHYPQNMGYTHDNSVVYNYGGGLDIDLVRNFGLKLDLQQQRWNTDTYKFTPVLGVIGITYHVPFRPR